jgi:hypothetical protein
VGLGRRTKVTSVLAEGGELRSPMPGLREEN